MSKLFNKKRLTVEGNRFSGKSEKNAGVYFLCFIFLILYSNCFYSQKDKNDYQENRDSTWGMDFDFSELDPNKINLKQLEKRLARIKTYNDSMMWLIRKKNIKERSDSLEQLYDLMSADTSTSYNAYSFFAGQYHSNLRGINNGLAAAKWPQLKNISYHFTNFINYTWKRNRNMNEVFFSVGSPVTIKNGDVSITYKYSSFLNYNYGYCVLDAKRYQFFPYLGLSYQISELTFANETQPIFEIGNKLYDTILKLTSVNKRGVEYRFKKQEIVLNYGAEFDFHALYSKRKTGLIVGLRAGGAQSILGGTWNLNGKKFPQIKNVNIKDYYFDLVLRIYTRGNGSGGKYYLKKGWWENEGE